MPFRRLSFLGLLALSLTSSLAHADDVVPPPSDNSDKLWFRNAGEYLSERSVMLGDPTDPTTKILTDFKRFDVTVGKRIPVWSFGEHGLTRGWTLGIDGGMLASLTRFNDQGNLTFATNTFDGFFGGWFGYQSNGWLFMARVGHLSAHLVDDSPQVMNFLRYSQFWKEIIVGKTFPNPDVASNWEIHIQGSVGLNNVSMPANSQPRATGSVSGGYSPWGTNKLAFLADANWLRAGVVGQASTYNFFVGFGTLNRPNSTRRPWRVGAAHYGGSDYRNQFYLDRENFNVMEVSTEF